MNEMQKKVSGALNTVSSVAKRSVKVFADALPIVTIVANVADAHARNPSLLGGTQLLIRKYTGIDMSKGTFDPQQAYEGLGTLLVAVGARYAIRALT